MPDVESTQGILRLCGLMTMKKMGKQSRETRSMVEGVVPTGSPTDRSEEEPFFVVVGVAAAAEEADNQVGEQADGVDGEDPKLVDAGLVDDVIVVLRVRGAAFRADDEEAEEDEVAVGAEDPGVSVGERGGRRPGEADGEVGDAWRVRRPEGQHEGDALAGDGPRRGGVGAGVEVDHVVEDDRAWEVVGVVVVAAVVGVRRTPVESVGCSHGRGGGEENWIGRRAAAESGSYRSIWSRRPFIRTIVRSSCHDGFGQAAAAMTRDAR
uniref:Uncharacterized protein n=1 Tax=Brachypodium distachyon TaxID=15368 RepID=C3SA42_BRADI|nr:hypothetical protein-1 [Brachypodium distachyon]